MKLVRLPLLVRQEYVVGCGTAPHKTPPAHHQLHRLDLTRLRHELAAFYGEAPWWISKRMAELRQELRAQLDDAET
jgi:hypothetical protein